ncbi:MAG: RNA polymerase sigma factor [Flavobacteriales bacterium]|nr:RNA polymerase sigma factor [Bacteroidota bacterium]MCB9240746.1 RNA polymerase sigma factor [Flavobacteriales bacterium]
MHQQTVATICIHMLKDRNLADEVGQEVFVRLYNGLKTFRHDASLKTFVSRIAMNLSLNKIKQQKTWWNRFTDLDSGPDPATSVTQDNFERKELIRKALSSIDERARSLIVLRMIEGYSVKETAEILEIKEGTVMSGTKRAMEKMKNELTKLGYEG